MTNPFTDNPYEAPVRAELVGEKPQRRSLREWLLISVASLVFSSLLFVAGIVNILPYALSIALIVLVVCMWASVSLAKLWLWLWSYTRD